MAALARLDQRTSWIRILAGSHAKRALQVRYYWFALAGVAMFGVGEGLVLYGMRDHQVAQYLLYVGAVLGAVTGLSALALALRNQRRLNALIVLLSKQEGGSGLT